MRSLLSLLSTLLIALSLSGCALFAPINAGDDEEESSDDDVGPAMPAPAPKKKKGMPPSLQQPRKQTDT